MKRIFIASAFIFFAVIIQAQNVGIGVPVPQQKLDVNGAIKIGTTTTNQPGAIRFNAGKFEGGDGTSWLPMEGLPQSSIVLSETEINASLTTAGYALVGKTQVTYAGFGASGSWVPVPIIDITDVNGIAAASGIWTGNRFIVWGGYHSGSNTVASGVKNLGYMHNPSTDSWTNTSITGAPAAREKHFGARAAGNKMLIFGGLSYTLTGASIPYGDGAIYDPLNNTWSTLFSTTGTPTPYAFVTGQKCLDTIANKLYTFNWYINVPYAYVYNINTNTWAPFTTSNCPPVTVQLGYSSVWMGTPVNKWMIWGGNPASGVTDGRIFNPASAAWESISPPPIGFQPATSPKLVWTGTDVIVYGGTLAGTDNNSNQAYRYNPNTNVWTTLSSLNKPSPRFQFSYVYGNNKFFIWGGFEKQFDLSYIKVNSGAYYDIVLNTWNEIPLTFSTPDRRAGSSIDWTGQNLYIWGGSSEAGRIGALSGGRYTPDLSGTGGFGGFQSKTYFLYKKQ